MDPVSIGSALSPAVRALVGRYLTANGHVISVDEFAAAGAAGTLEPALAGVYDAVGTYL
jgi:hypothetical protein